MIFLNIFLASLAFNIIFVMPPFYFKEDIIGQVYGFVNVLGRVGGIMAPFASEYVAPNVILIASGLLGLTCTLFIRNQKYYDPK